MSGERGRKKKKKTFLRDFTITNLRGEGGSGQILALALLHKICRKRNDDGSVIDGRKRDNSMTLLLEKKKKN